MPKGIKGWAIFVAAQLALTTIIKFVFKLADNALMGWGDDKIAAYVGIKSPDVATVFNWAVPFILAALTLWVYHFVHYWPQSRKRAISQEKEIGLLEAVWWVAKSSAWSRWQDAQRPKWLADDARLTFAASFVRTAAINGDLAIRGRLINSVEYQDINRDFWRSARIDFQPYDSFVKLLILPLGGVAIPNYDGLIVERSSVETLWPAREWKYDWRALYLCLKSKLKKPSLNMPEVEKKDEKPQPDEVKVTPPVAQVVAPAPAPIPVVRFSPPADAPNGWDKLFAVGDDGRSVWLRFLPDTKQEKTDALLLIIYGQKILLGNSRVPIQAAYNAVQKSVDVAPSRTYIPQTIMARWAITLSALNAINEPDYAAQLLGSSLRRVGLSQGGMFELTESGEQKAANLTYDLIDRA